MEINKEQFKEIIYERSIPEPMSGCWLWVGHRTNHKTHPYGEIYKNDRKYAAHRIVAHIWHGLDLKNSKILARHKCDNTLCVNPRHLIPGSQADNMADAKLRNRMARGENHPHARLNEITVVIGLKLLAKGISPQAVAARFKVHFRTFYSVLQGQSWTRVTSQHPELLKEAIQNSVKAKPSRAPQRIKCLNTGEIFKSLRAAAEHFNTYSTAVSLSATNNKPTIHGLRFEYIKD